MDLTNWTNDQLLCFFYIFSNAICFISLQFVLCKYLRNERPRKIDKIFSRIIVAHSVYFVLDIFWALLNYNILQLNPICLKILRAVEYSVVSMATFLWFLFISIFVNAFYLKSRKGTIIINLPCTFNVIFSIIFCLFFYDGELYKTILITLIPFIYMVVASTYASYKIMGHKEILDKRNSVLYVLYPLLLIVFAAIQIVVHDVPSLCFGTTFVVLLIYFHSLTNKISTDNLTGLYNRNELNRYIFNNIKSNDNVFVVLCDLDDFKKINDLHGHLTGDKALVCASKILKEALTNKQSFLARFGGDEFIIILKDVRDIEIEELYLKIDEIADNYNKDNDEYKISISKGKAHMQYDENFIDLINRADQNLYDMKKEKHKNRI